MRFFRESKSVNQRYLKCHDAVTKAGCDAGYINYDALEQEVIGWLLLDQDEEIVHVLEKKPARKAVRSAEIEALKARRTQYLDMLDGGLMNTQPVIERLNAIEVQIKEHSSIAVEVQDNDERLPAEKAWGLAIRHQDAALGDDKQELYAVRRELKTAFQKSILALHVFPEERIGDVHHGKISVQFRGYDGESVRKYKRPALIAIKGVWNTKNPQVA